MPRYQEETKKLADDLAVTFHPNGVVTLREIGKVSRATRSFLLGEGEFNTLLIEGIRNRSNHNPTDRKE
jgi:hypothetical protein